MSPEDECRSSRWPPTYQSQTTRKAAGGNSINIS